jgi:hypothetical protein
MVDMRTSGTNPPLDDDDIHPPENPRHLALLPLRVPRLKASSALTKTDCLVLFILDSAPSSPKRNAAFSLFGPEFGRLPDLRNGDGDLGGEDLWEDPEVVSGSSIHEKLDCAMLDLVGTGAFGLAGNSASPAGSVLASCKSMDGTVVDGVVIVASSLIERVSWIGLD